MEMKSILRGPFVSRILEGCGINPRHYWLLVDLFGQLSERHEFMSQLGRSGFALNSMALFYFVFSIVFSVIFLLIGVSARLCLLACLLFTVLILFTLLISETNNSLVNPVEGLVLSHQPIAGATYTAAKLSHLARILLYVVPALNAAPAVAGLWLPGARWFYPLLHLGAAFALGLLIAFFCCALFGWLIRFVPAPRLKVVGNWAELLAWFSYFLFPQSLRLVRHYHLAHLVPAPGAPRWALGIGLMLLAAASVVFGLQSLSVDYMLRVSSIVHGGSGAQVKAKRQQRNGDFASWLGGQLGRAGYEYVSQMMTRDWVFLRQTIAILPLVVMTGVGMYPGLRTSPFSRHFTPLHALPHLFGFLLLLVCIALPYGNHDKGAWVFLLAPVHSFRRFAAGVLALLWLRFILVPHLFLLALLTWFWGIRDASAFLAYSLAVSSFYVGLELRLVESVPFSRQPRASQGAMLLPLMIVGGLAASLVGALQYYFVFRSLVATLATTAAVAVAAFFLIRSSLTSVGDSMRFDLGRLTGESTFLYQET